MNPQIGTAYKGHRTACAVCGRKFRAKGPRGKYCGPSCYRTAQTANIARQTARRTFLMDLGIPYHGKSLAPRTGNDGERIIPLGLSEEGWTVVSDPSKTTREKWDALSVEDQRKVIAELEREKINVEEALRKIKEG